jgi:hypothetical protein
MRKIVDSNFLRDDALKSYFSSSRWNFAILNDYAAIEAYKGDTLKSIYHSMEILTEYPKQVIILKSTRFVCGLQGRATGMQRRMIDEHQTRQFGRYCRALLAAKRGDLSIERQLLDLGREANEQMDKMLAGIADIPLAIEEMASAYSDVDLKILRRDRIATNAFLVKFIQSVLELSATLFVQHPEVIKFPNTDELPYTFIFRASLCFLLSARRWISVGGARKAKTEKLRNDMVDSYFAAYATYFDGLLTFDKKLIEIYEEASSLTQEIIDSRRTQP